MEMRIAYSYRRCSTPRQLKGASFDRQDFASRVCQRHGWRLNTELRLDDRGLSAFHGTNRLVGALGRFLAAVKDERIKPPAVLIIEDQDRFSREQVFDALSVWIELLKAGIGIYVETFDLEFSRETINANPTLLHMAIGSMTRAHAESARKSEVIADTWERRREKAKQLHPLNSYCPAYLYLDREAGAYRFKPDAVDTMRRIIGRALDGVGTTLLARELNEAQVPHFGRGPLWCKAYLHKLLTSRALVGEGQPKRRDGNKAVPVGDPIPGYYPALLTEAEFARLRLALQARRDDRGPKKHGLLNLFTGLLWCPRDRSRMQIVSTTGYSKRYYYLFSGTGVRGGAHGQCKVRYAFFEEVVLRYFRELTVADLTGRATPDDVSQIEAQVAAVKVDLDKIEEQLVEGGKDIPVLSRAAKRLTEKYEALKARAAEAQARQDAGNAGALRSTQSIIEALAGGEGDQLHEMRLRLKARIRELVLRIEVGQEKQNHSSRRVFVTLIFRAGGRRSLWFDQTKAGLARHGLVAVGGRMPAADVGAL